MSLLMNFLQTKLRVKSMKTNFYDLYYTVFENRVEKQDKIDDNIIDYYYDDISTPSKSRKDNVISR